MVPGNIVDAVTLINTLDELRNLGAHHGEIHVDAGYGTMANIDDLYKPDVNFVTRLRPNYKLYNAMVSRNQDVCLRPIARYTTGISCTSKESRRT